jgi:hypothetical protein
MSHLRREHNVFCDIPEIKKENKARKCGEIGGKRKGELDEAVKEGGLG